MYAELPQAPQAIGPLSPWAAPRLSTTSRPVSFSHEQFCPFTHVAEGKNTGFLCGIDELRRRTFSNLINSVK